MSHEPVVSVVIPGHGPKATLRGALRSRPAQTDPWRAIVTSDDGVGRLAVLERAGSRHDWLLQVSAGACERGEGNAGNVALAPVLGPILCGLNANDEFTAKGLFRLPVERAPRLARGFSGAGPERAGAPGRSRAGVPERGGGRCRLSGQPS